MIQLGGTWGQSCSQLRETGHGVLGVIYTYVFVYFFIKCLCDLQGQNDSTHGNSLRDSQGQTQELRHQWKAISISSGQEPSSISWY